MSGVLILGGGGEGALVGEIENRTLTKAEKKARLKNIFISCIFSKGFMCAAT